MRKLFIVFSILLFVSQMQVGYMRLHPFPVDPNPPAAEIFWDSSNYVRGTYSYLPNTGSLGDIASLTQDNITNAPTVDSSGLIFTGAQTLLNNSSNILNPASPVDVVIRLKISTSPGYAPLIRSLGDAVCIDIAGTATRVDISGAPYSMVCNGPVPGDGQFHTIIWQLRNGAETKAYVDGIQKTVADNTRFGAAGLSGPSIGNRGGVWPFGTDNRIRWIRMFRTPLNNAQIAGSTQW